MLIPLAIYLARRSARRIWFLPAGLLAMGALATVSRTSILMLVVVGLVFLWLRPVETKRLWPVLLPGLIAVHIALPGTLGSQIGRASCRARVEISVVSVSLKKKLTIAI